MKQSELERLRKYDIDIKKQLVLLNEESFKSFEAKILWINIRPKTGEFRY